MWQTTSVDIDYRFNDNGNEQWAMSNECLYWGVVEETKQKNKNMNKINDKRR